MARTLQTTLSLLLKGSYANVLTDTSEPSVQWTSGKIESTLETGTIVDTADRLWSSKARALTSGSSLDIDLFDLGSIDIGNGAGRDQLGLAQSNVELVGLLVVLKKGSAGSLRLDTDNPTNPLTTMLDGLLTIKASSVNDAVSFILSPADGANTIADASAHQIRVTAVGGNITYDIFLILRSA